MEEQSFNSFMTALKESPKDGNQELTRLASVAAAVCEIVGGRDVKLSSLRVYQAILVTLEGSAQKQSSNRDELGDCYRTQSSLLELLKLILPFIESAALLQAERPTIKCLRLVRCSIISVYENQNGIVGSNLDASEGIVGSTSVLRSISSFSTACIRALSGPSGVSGATFVKHLFKGLLLVSLDDSCSNVRDNAKHNIEELLRMENPRCHFAVCDEINHRLISALDSIKSSPDPTRTGGERSIMNLLNLAGKFIMSLDFASIGERQVSIICLLADRNAEKSQQYVLKKNESTALIAKIMLSTLLRIVESKGGDQACDLFAGRALATLLQIQPNLIAQGGDSETSVTCLDLFAQVLISAIARLLEGDYRKGVALLPLTINHLLVLGDVYGRRDAGLSFPDSWFLRLLSILQKGLFSIRTKDMAAHSKCCYSCLSMMTGAHRLCAEQARRGPLLCVGELLSQADSNDEHIGEIILNLVSLRENVLPGTETAVAAEGALLRVLKEYGIERFWNQINFSQLFLDEHGRISVAWLLSLFKQAGPQAVQGRKALAFFHDILLPLARKFDSRAREETIQTEESLEHKQQVVGIWSLFPCFCVNQTDLDASLVDKLAPIFIRGMKDKHYPELLIFISTGIDVLARGAKDRVDEISDLTEESDLAIFRKDGHCISELSEKLLPVMFKLAVDLYGTSRIANSEVLRLQERALTAAISSLARLSPHNVLHALFKKLVHRLLEASQSSNDTNEKMCSLLTLAHSLHLSCCLDDSSILLLYRVLRPLVGTDETHPSVQKRSYKLLGELCRSKEFMSEERQVQILDLLTSSTSHVASRPMRLRCLESVVVLGAIKSPAEYEQRLPLLIGEILLCLKDSNKKTRDASFAFLASLSRRFDKTLVFHCVAAAIASETPLMRSAAAVALAMLVHEHAVRDMHVQHLLPSMIKTIFVLADDPSREVIKSTILFVRITVTICPRDIVAPLLPLLLDILLKYHKNKERFREKIKNILKKMVKIFGLATMLPLVSERDDQALLYMTKLPTAGLKSGKGEVHAKSLGDMIISDDENSDDEIETPCRRVMVTKKLPSGSASTLIDSRGSGVRENAHYFLIRNDMRGRSMDVNDLAIRVRDKVEAAVDSDNEIDFDEDGRLILKAEGLTVPYDQRSDVATAISTGGGVEDRKPTSRRKGTVQEVGAAYKCKKAGGDVKRNFQRFDPYAYVPLDSRLYAKKNRHRAVEQLDSVVRARKRLKR